MEQEDTNITIFNKEIFRLNLIFSIILIFISTILAIYTELVALLLIGALSIFFIFKKQGLEIDTSEKRYRNFKQNFGKRKGKWISFKENTVIVMLTKKGKQTTSGTNGTGSLETKHQLFELYFMDPKHRRKIYIHSSNQSKKIEALRDQLSTELSFPVEKYKPKF